MAIACRYLLTAAAVRDGTKNRTQHDHLPTPLTTVKINPLAGALKTTPDALSLVLEQMALINARLDAHATKITALRHRDAMRDAPPIYTLPIKSVTSEVGPFA
jgi:hypothetical protein